MRARRNGTIGSVGVVLASLGLLVGCGGGGDDPSANGQKGVGVDCFEQVEAFIEDGGVDAPRGLSADAVSSSVEESCEEAAPTTPVERVAVHAMFLARINQLAQGEG